MKKVLFMSFVLFNLLVIGGVSSLVIDSVIMSSEGIMLGESTEIEIGLRNNGEEDVTDVSVFLDLNDVPFAPYDSSSEFGIDEIREDRMKFARFEIIALEGVQSKFYKVPIKISYMEDEILKTKDSLISIKVVSDPIIEIIAEDSWLLKNLNNLVRIKLINKGLTDIQFLEVEVRSASNKYSLTSSRKIYVGDLDSDDFENVEFNIFFEKDIQDLVILPVILRYKDAFNNAYEREFDVALKVYTNKKAIKLGLKKKSNTSQIVSLLIVLFIIYFIYRWLRKRNKNKKRNKEKDEF